MNRDRPIAPIAVALSYAGQGAPSVTATGRGAIADVIVRVARDHGVPLRSTPELAQILATVELDNEVPEPLYRAVAEVLAFAYRLRGSMSRPLGDNQDPTWPQRLVGSRFSRMT